MIFGSVCSGIEAASAAWLPLGMECAFMSEIEAFPRAVLKHHYPETPLHGDFTTIGADNYGAIDLLVGGTPCQSFSVAGLRGGLADSRGNLALEFLRLADRKRPRWIVWENVPGVLSSNGGRDFSAILGGLAELGYGWAYRVLDAQFFGVPQRRRRVFVVGYFGDWRRAAAVLFERESLRGDSPPRRQSREGIAPTISARPTGDGGLGTDFDLDGGLVQTAIQPVAIQERAICENPAAGPDGVGVRTDGLAYTLESRTVPQAVLAGAFRTSPNCGGWDTGDRIDALTTGTDPTSHVLAFGRNDQRGPIEVATARNAHAGPHGRLDFETETFIACHGVRRLTPRECERLQGFPDDYTLIPHRRRMAADGPRYKSLGNSMAVPVMRWIGRRIMVADP